MKTHLLLRILAILWPVNLTTAHAYSNQIKMISSRDNLGRLIPLKQMNYFPPSVWKALKKT